jgi:hypothetical protein
VFEVLFHGGEAVFELRVGVGHEEFGVGVAEAGEVDLRDEDIQRAGSRKRRSKDRQSEVASELSSDFMVKVQAKGESRVR